MTTMHAAVVEAFDRPPRYETFPVPQADGDGSFVVDVLAAGLHPRVRSGAAGRHYTSTGELPIIPGVDAVGRRADGGLVYFVADDHAQGTMAERALVGPRRAVELPAGVDVARIAATMNPAMSSWVALRRRVALQPGQDVLVLGATGSAGSAAVQLAKRLGAGRVIGAGRDPIRLGFLGELGADAVVRLTDDVAQTGRALAEQAADVDVVLDYLWGPPAQSTITALLSARADRSRALDWVQIGSVAGASIELASAVLRSANFRLLGNGQGAVSPSGYLAELPALVREIELGGFAITADPKALAEVERVWSEPDPPGHRTVLIP